MRYFTILLLGVGAQRQVPFRQCHNQMQGDRFLLVELTDREKIGQETAVRALVDAT